MQVTCLGSGIQRLAGDFEGGSTLEQECKCAKVHEIVASLSPMKDNSFRSVRCFTGQYGWEDVLLSSGLRLCP